MAWRGEGGGGPSRPRAFDEEADYDDWQQREAPRQARYGEAYGRDHRAEPESDYGYGYADDYDYEDRGGTSSSRRYEPHHERERASYYGRDRYQDNRYYEEDPYRYDRPDDRRQRPVPPPRSPPSRSRPVVPAPSDEPERTPSPDPELEAFIAASKAKEASSSKQPKKTEEQIKAVFCTGMARKSKYQKEKEEAERKRKIEEEEAAAAYKEFVAAMDGPSSRKGRKSGGKGGSSGFVSSSGAAYVPAAAPPSTNAAPPAQPPAPKAPRSSGGPPAKLGAFGDPDEDEAEQERQLAAKAGPPGKKRGAMETFASQLQRQQAEREERLKDKIPEGKSISAVLAMQGERVGSKPVMDDPLSTNICVRDLPAGVTEPALGDFFSQWGDVATVKIMWPRGDEFSSGGAGAGMTGMRKDKLFGLVGFVSFMERQDAELALRESDGVSWGGSIIKTGWGKAMPKPPRAAYTMSAAARKGRRRSPSPFRAVGRRRSRSRSRSPRRHRRHRESPEPRARLQRMITDGNGDAVDTKYIDAVAQRIAQHGPSFEQMLRAKEQDNPQFRFLYDEDSLGHQYFRTLLDPNYEPKLPAEPFQDEGIADLYSSDSEEDEEAERARKSRQPGLLGRATRSRFEAMLRGITPRRERVALAMQFALEHAQAAEEITRILIESLLLHSTPVPRKLARLYVVSDVLHNSAAPIPNAWRYRQLLEDALTPVFTHLGDVAKSFPGRMKMEGFKMQIGAVLDTWDSWMIFSSASLESWRTLLDEGSGRTVHQAEEKAERPQQRVEQDDADLDGEALPLVDSVDQRGKEDVENLDGEDLDGEGLDGETLDAPQSREAGGDEAMDGEDLDGGAL